MAGTYYTQKIKMPKNMREGLANFVQMIINNIEAENYREALLKAVDLRQDIDSKIYDEVIAFTDVRKLEVEMSAREEDFEKRLASAVRAAELRGATQERERILSAVSKAA